MKAFVSPEERLSHFACCQWLFWLRARSAARLGLRRPLCSSSRLFGCDAVLILIDTMRCVNVRFAELSCSVFAGAAARLTQFAAVGSANARECAPCLQRRQLRR